jgi:hypothetical protein
MFKRLILLAAASIIAVSCNQPTPAPSPTQAASPTATAASPAPSPSPTFEGRLIEVQVSGGNVSPNPDLVEVELGEFVRIQVTSDQADELHVHGYERKAELAPGIETVVEFRAEIPGTFRVELERSRLRLFDLRVQ